MAVGLKRIEKEFLIKSIFDDQVPVTMNATGREESFVISRLEKDFIVLKSRRKLEDVRKGQKGTFFVHHRGQVLNFTATILDVKEGNVTIALPESLYKNLRRKYARIPGPTDISVGFSFHGERYDMDFPKSEQFEPVDSPEFSEDFDSDNLKQLLEQFNAKAEEYCDEHKIVMFRENKPSTVEERVIAKTGKVVFIPSTLSDFPANDPYIKKKLITKQLMEDFLESLGIARGLLIEETNKMIRTKRAQGVLSELLHPVIFHEYVIGYILLRNSAKGKPPFDLNLVDLMGQFAKVLSYSLKKNGYFKGAEGKKDEYDGHVIDISASGLLFENKQALLAQSLLMGSELMLSLKTPKRRIEVAGKVVRNFRDSRTHYYGVDYRDMQPEDLRFLFELLYGRPFTDMDMNRLEGGLELDHAVL